MAINHASQRIGCGRGKILQVSSAPDVGAIAVGMFGTRSKL
jgi:hypothetical protein